MALMGTGGIGVVYLAGPELHTAARSELKEAVFHTGTLGDFFMSAARRYLGLETTAQQTSHLPLRRVGKR